ncbi:ABC transporter substrate-binding protein [Rhodococcus sp. 14-2483-1-2]|uniref:ABC transporter substrate-binding protein n=1 Tax=Rhodococcus sp. 14-2483-1-2 TaxID=2023147 RepID=UPI000B9ACF57|nr:ABC transporter substrate-binding protein [Rhodococcus sp. 14-2483-1-2]OZF28529.1 iron siderophore-binding protein [Rhodococcus sp. 14-2483-1-2]
MSNPAVSNFKPRRRGIRLLASVSVALIALGLTSCSTSSDGDDGAPAGESTTSETRVISTDRGDVTVPADPQRIAVLSAGFAGYLYTLDAPIAITDTRLLGVTNLDGGFPPQWAEKAKAQGTKELPAGEALNIEAIAQADPDLIIGGGQGYSAVLANDAYDQLAAIAPTVLIPSSVNTWQGELEAVADAAGEADKVDGLLQAYEDKVAQVSDAITVPGSPVAYLLSLSTNEPSFIPQTAALPTLLSEVGFEADDIITKAGNPELYGSGDSFIVSPELLGSVATAPVMFVVPVAGRTLDELKQDPAYAGLPAFSDNKVYELPATSYRPDYDGVMSTLDTIQQTFAS